MILLYKKRDGKARHCSVLGMQAGRRRWWTATTGDEPQFGEAVAGEYGGECRLSQTASIAGGMSAAECREDWSAVGSGRGERVWEATRPLPEKSSVRPPRKLVIWQFGRSYQSLSFMSSIRLV